MGIEPIIHDGNYKDFIDVHVDGELKGRGCIPRDWKTHPAGCYSSAPMAALNICR